MDVLVPKVIFTLISKGNSIFFWTAVDTARSFQQAKTKFYFEPKKGIVSLEQKLPMPLAAFNETPAFHVSQNRKRGQLRFFLYSIHYVVSVFWASFKRMECSILFKKLKI